MEPQPPFQSVEPIDPAPKKLSPLLMIVFGLITLAMLGGIGYYAYSTFMLTQKPRQPQTPAPIAKKVETPDISADDTIKDIADTLRAGAVDFEGTTPSHQAKGFDYVTDLGVKTQSVSVERNASESQTALVAVRDYLKSKNFSESIKKDDKSALNYDAEYRSRTVLCSVTRSKASQEETTLVYIVRAACADVRMYEELAKLQQPFYQLFVAERNADIALKNITLIGRPEYNNSPVIGYMTVEQAIRTDTETGRTLFYQTPDKTWHYYTYLASDDTFSCSMLKTPDQKRAFGGQQCDAISENSRAN